MERSIEVSHQRYQGGIPFVMQSSASTFGEFKAELKAAKDLDINENNRVTLTSHGERDLISDGELLPAGDLIIYVTPKQMKAGVC